MRTLHGSRCFRMKRVRVIILCSLPSRSLMSLLNIPHWSFPQVLSSSTCSRSRPWASTSSMGRSFREKPCEPARWSGMSGRMANPAPNTVYEPNQLLQLHGHTAHADPPPKQPPRFPVPGRRFRDLHHRSRRCAALSSKQTAASRVPSTFGPSLWKQMAGPVSGRPGLQEAGALADRESVATTIFSSQSKGKSDRDQNVVHSSRDRENLQKIIERKFDSAVRGEMMAQQKLYDAEARNWEKKNSDIAFQEINQEVESQRFQPHQASRWADQAQRGFVRVENFQEIHARDCREIVEMRSTCYEEADRARQARSDELWRLFMQQEWNPTTVSLMMAQIRELQNKVNSLSDARASHDPESGRSSGATHVSDRTFTILSPVTFPRCDSGLPSDTLNGKVLQDTFLNDYLLEKDKPLQSSTIQRIWHPLLWNWG